MAFLEIQRLTKRFGDLVVLDELSLDVAEGEVLALLGPSGSGKTTFLRALAGFETVDSGSIRAAGREVTRIPASGRGFGMVFQHYALFPHLSVAGNVAFGLETRNVERSRIRDRVEEVLALVDLEGYGERPVGALSGGQQQRVALARALAPDPPLLLLDEPLSNLDPTLRERTRQELLAAIRRVGITTVLVTHEQEEAFHLGDRVAVLWRGRLQQVGSPEELYLEPRSRFVASFIGRSTALPGVVEGVAARADGPDGCCQVRLDGLGSGAGPIRGPVWEGRMVEGAEPFEPGTEVALVVRPESLRLVPEGEEAPGSVAGRVVGRRYGGLVTYYQVRPDDSAGAARAAGAASAASAVTGEAEALPEIEVLADLLSDRGLSERAPDEGDRVRIAPRQDGPVPVAFLRSSEAPPWGPDEADGEAGGAGDGERVTP